MAEKSLAGYKDVQNNRVRITNYSFAGRTHHSAHMKMQIPMLFFSSFAYACLHGISGLRSMTLLDEES